MLFEFDMSMTWRETWYFFFAKKICPECGGPLRRQTSTRDEGFAWRRDGLNFNSSHKTTATVEYECRPCRIWYSIGELASRRGPTRR